MDVISVDAYTLFEHMWKNRTGNDVFTGTVAIAVKDAGLHANRQMAVTKELKDSGLVYFIARRGWKLFSARTDEVRIRELDASVSELLDSAPRQDRVIDLTRSDTVGGYDFSSLDEGVSEPGTPEAPVIQTARDREEEEVDDRQFADSLARQFLERFEELLHRPDSEEQTPGLRAEDQEQWERTVSRLSQQIGDLTEARDAAVREAQEAKADKERLEIQVGQLMREVGESTSGDEMVQKARRFLSTGAHLR